MKRAQASLRIVPDDKPTEPEDLLAEIVPSLAAAEKAAARLRELMLEQGRALARKRRVSFIREEHLRREFAPR